MATNPQDQFVPLQELLHAFADTFGSYPPASKLNEFLERLNASGWMLVPVDEYLKTKSIEPSLNLVEYRGNKPPEQ